MRLREFIVFFEIKGGDTHEFLVDECAEMKSEFIVITLKDTVIQRPIRAQHLVSNMMCVNWFDS